MEKTDEIELLKKWVANYVYKTVRLEKAERLTRPDDHYGEWHECEDCVYYQLSTPFSNTDNVVDARIPFLELNTKTGGIRLIYA